MARASARSAAKKNRGSVHPSSVVGAGVTLGKAVKIWHFCHVMAGATLGAGVMLGQGCFVGARVVIGARSRLQNQVSVFEGVVLEEDVFVGPSAVFTNVRTPRARKFACAACGTAGEPLWLASTSAPWLTSAWAASRSRAGSNQVLSQTTRTCAAGLIARMPSVNALMPCTTSGTGKPATYPAMPLRLVAPFPPGGEIDLVARGLGQKMSESLGQPVVVENIAGAAGAIGSERVAKSAPDGYTILLGATTTHGINPALNPKLPYDAVKDFTPISLVTTIPHVLVVNAAVQGETIDDVMVSYRAAACKGIVLSKLDEAVKLAPALDAAIRHRQKIVAIANGQRVPEDWHRLSAQALVHRALRGGGSPAYRFDAGDMNLVFAAPQSAGRRPAAL